MPPKRVVSRRTYVDPNKAGDRRPLGTRRVLQGQVEAEWTCTSCGRDSIPGHVKKCPICGNPKGSDEAYQPPAPGAPLLSQAQLDDMGVDAEHTSDQQCPYCQGFSKPGTDVCPNCGSNLDDVARTSRKCSNCGRETNLVTCPQCGSETKSKNPKPTLQPADAPPRRDPPRLNITESLDALKPFWWAPVILLVIGLLGFFFWPRETTASVSAVSWKCEVLLQEYQYNQHGGWSVPAGGELVNQDQRIHHYSQVLDHYERECHTEQQPDGYDTEHYTEEVCESVYDHTEETCYDDGTCDREDVYETECHGEDRTRQVAQYKDVEVCEQVPKYRDEPVYATYYTYNVWEWVSIASAITTGSDFEPRWSTDYRIDDKHREAGRQQYFTVTLVDKKEESFTYHPASLEEYRLFQIGTTWKVTHSGGEVTEIEPID